MVLPHVVNQLLIKVGLFVLICPPKLLLLFLKKKMGFPDNNFQNALFVSLSRVPWMTPKKISRSRKRSLVKEKL